MEGACVGDVTGRSASFLSLFFSFVFSGWRCWDMDRVTLRGLSMMGYYGSGDDCKLEAQEPTLWTQVSHVGYLPWYANWGLYDMHMWGYVLNQQCVAHAVCQTEKGHGSV